MNAIKYLAVSQINNPADPASTERIAPGQLKVLKAGKGKVLTCTAGRLWVTLESLPADIILEAEESVALDRKGIAVVSGLREGSFSVG
jgi:hypothetical protein